MTYQKNNIQTRKRGKDKAKESRKKNGKFSSKHLRSQEQLKEKRKNQPKKVKGGYPGGLV